MPFKHMIAADQTGFMALNAGDLEQN